MDLGKFIMNMTGWGLIVLGLLGMISVIAYGSYHLFWLHQSYSVPAAQQPTIVSFGSISPMLLLLFPFALSLLAVCIGRLVRKNVRSQGVATVG